MCYAAIASGVSSISQSYQGVKQAEYGQGVASYNARVLENDATNVRNQGTESENIQRQKTAETLSTQRAQLGAAGVVIDSGSAASVQQSTITLGEADARRIRTNTSSKVTNLTDRARLIRADADAKKAAADSAYNMTLNTYLSGADSKIVSSIWN